MEFSFYGHAFFYYIRVFLFHDGGTLIGIYFMIWDMERGKDKTW